MSLKINNTYSFITLAPAILGNKYEMQKVKSIMSVSEAVKHSDVHTIHNSLKSVVTSLPDIEHCTFILFSNSDGNDTILAYEWLDSESITTVKKVNATYTVTDISSEDVSIIRNKLLELGYKNVETVVN